MQGTRKKQKFADKVVPRFCGRHNDNKQDGSRLKEATGQREETSQRDRTKDRLQQEKDAEYQTTPESTMQKEGLLKITGR